MKSSTQLIIDKIHRILTGEYKRILLIQPFQFPEELFNIRMVKNKRYYNHPPYGFGVLCANLKRRGYEVHIIDLNMELLSFIHREEDENFIRKNLAVLWKERINKVISEFQPDMVGVTCMYTMSHRVFVNVVDFIKSLDDRLPIVAGGVHVTNAPEVVLRDAKGVDFVSLYEGDESFCDFLDFVNGKTGPDRLNQIGTLIDKRYIALAKRIPPGEKAIDVIPDYLDLEIDRYGSIGEVGAFRYWSREDCRNGTVLTNRGCRGRCSFCSVRYFNGFGIRQRSVGSVIDEIEGLISRYRINHISWLDDDLFYNPKRTIQLFSEIIKRSLDITWDAMNGVIASAVALHPEIVHSAAESGCIGMNIGLESGNLEILQKTHKPSTIEHYLKAGNLMQKYPQIFVRSYLIIGFPGETYAQLLDTINVAQRMGSDWNTISRLRPLPSTELYSQMLDDGLIDDGSFSGRGRVVRESERQRVREKEEKVNAKEFVNLFEQRDLGDVPVPEEMDDVWLIMDYKVNYEKILKEEHPVRLKKMQVFLRDVSNRMAIDNPLSTLFLGIVENKLGNLWEAERYISLSREYLMESMYWQKRFNVIGLDSLYDHCKVSK